MPPHQGQPFAELQSIVVRWADFAAWKLHLLTQETANLLLLFLALR